MVWNRTTNATHTLRSNQQLWCYRDLSDERKGHESSQRSAASQPRSRLFDDLLLSIRGSASGDKLLLASTPSRTRPRPRSTWHALLLPRTCRLGAGNEWIWRGSEDKNSRGSRHDRRGGKKSDELPLGRVLSDLQAQARRRISPRAPPCGRVQERRVNPVKSCIVG